MLLKHMAAFAATALISTAAGAETKAAADAHAHGHVISDGDQSKQVRAILKNIVDDEDIFVRMHKQSYFEPFIKKQSPRATVVTCADSRVHSQALDTTPEGDLVLVRNIDLHRGHGKLVITHVNGETDPAKQSRLVKL